MKQVDRPSLILTIPWQFKWQPISWPYFKETKQWTDKQGNRPEDPVCPFTTPRESQTKISSFGVQTSYKLTCAIWQSGELLAMGLKYFILLLKTVPSYWVTKYCFEIIHWRKPVCVCSVNNAKVLITNYGSGNLQNVPHPIKQTHAWQINHLSIVLRVNNILWI